MEINLRNQKATLPYRISNLKSLPLSYDNVRNFPDRTLSVRIPISNPPRNLSNCDFKFLFFYEIFPPRILSFLGEWQLSGRLMKTGDVIAQQAYLPPVSTGIKLLFGVRVLDVYQSETRAGFRYGTLTGHPETGENEFYFSIVENHLLATVHTSAKPGLFLSRVLAPILTNPYAAFCNNEALNRMKENYLKYNPEARMKRGKQERKRA